MTRTMKSLKTLALAFCLAIVGGGLLTACSEEGPAEKTGAKIDRFLKDAGDTMSDAADEAEDALEEATEKTKKALEEAKD
jgi:hypothetical protein